MIQIIFIYCFQIYFSCLLSLSNFCLCKDLKEDDENEIPIIVVGMLSNKTLLMMYMHFFQFPNTGVIRKIIPSQPLRAKEVGVFCSKQIKTFDINPGQGSLSVNSKENAH